MFPLWSLYICFRIFFGRSIGQLSPLRISRMLNLLTMLNKPCLSFLRRLLFILNPVSLHFVLLINYSQCSEILFLHSLFLRPLSFIDDLIIFPTQITPQSPLPPFHCALAFYTSRLLSHVRYSCAFRLILEADDQSTHFFL